MKRFWRKIEFWKKRIKVWQPCNIYHSSKISEDVSIGAFTEIGHNVAVGRGTRIGAHCFLPEGVCVGEQVFIGPNTTFTNDMYPPSPRNEWRKTIVADKASIGAGATILPGVVIGKGSKVGAGSVVTKNVPDGETWAGVPAKRLKDGD